VTLQPRFAWLLALGCLATLVLARISFLQVSPDLEASTIAIGAAAIIAIVAIQGAIILGAAARGLLPAQVLLTFAPFLIIGEAWGPIAGVLGAAILLTMAAPAAWVLFLLVVTADAMLLGALRGATGPVVFATPLFIDLMVGITLFSVARLAQLVQGAEDTRRRLAAIEAEAERLRVARRLRESVGAVLSALIQRARDVRERAEPNVAELRDIGELALRASNDARTVADVHEELVQGTRQPVDPAQASVPFRFAWWMGLVLVFIHLGHAIVFFAQPASATSAHWAMAVPTVLAAGLLQLYHGFPRADATAPRLWMWTLPAQILLLAVSAAVFGGSWTLPLLVLAMGAVLTRVCAPWSWVLVGAVLLSLSFLPLDFGPGGPLYWTAWMAAGVLSVYALCNLPDVTRRLHETRDQLARMATVTERLRFTRDVHDLLGFHLAAMGLKCELAVRALDADPGRARQHLAEVQRSAEDALAEVRSIGESAELDLREEITAAQSLLTAAGVHVTVSCSARPPQPRVDHLLGVVLREAVTNVIRHSRARTCTIAVDSEGGAIRMRIVNDGDTHSPSEGGRRGTGLNNLIARAEAAGGRLAISVRGDTFTVTVEIPCDLRQRPSESPPARLP
jgi:two-component system sensor histidine kinase DesK